MISSHAYCIYEVACLVLFLATGVVKQADVHFPLHKERTVKIMKVFLLDLMRYFKKTILFPF